MARYIDADRLLNEVTGNGGVFVYGIDIIKAFISRITAQPTADVQEVKHGYWIYNLTYYESDECNCSLCGQLMTTAKGVRMNYCPNCGAKMDGDVE